MPKKDTNLVIVESPAKAKTIKNYLGNGYEVMASVGHIVDLPSKKFGVDIKDGFKPDYEVIPGKESIVAKLKQAAKNSGKVFLASDPDREGEAIAWHIQEQIKAVAKDIARVQFNEITKQGIADAMKSPGLVDMHKVNAQQSRRILDRIVGYQVSPLLWKPLKYGLSAGRVQSVALRMVCEREEEIERFVPEESWTLDAYFDIYDNSKKLGLLKTTLDKKNGKKFTMKKESEADEVINFLKGKDYVIANVEKKDVKVSAPMPFVTARMQQEAIRKLGFTAKKAMSIAQQLYEGVELGNEGAQGLITYMRTDSVRVSPEALNGAFSYIKGEYGDDYLGRVKAPKKSKAKTQDAHEAIRPTVPSRTPESIKNYLSKDQFRLYKLIWDRFIASCMADAIYDQTTVLVESEPYQFRASGRVLKFAGYTILYTESADEDSEQEKDNALLSVDVKNTPKLNKFDKKQHFTTPPPRFTEASIVKMLEQKGVGRPSTYASIISTILDREYVTLKEKRMYPTELGRIVTKLLVQNFPKIFDIHFTAVMEEGLDKVEGGNVDWHQLLEDFYSSFSKELQTAEKKFNADLSIEELCPTCSKELTIKYGKNGSFIACSGYPDCSFTTDFKRDENGGIVFVDKPPLDILCEKCGSNMAIKNSRFGEILACTAYPDCKNIKNFIRLPDGTVKVLNTGDDLGKACPKCEDGRVVLKMGKNGLFAACSNYPSCKFTASVEVSEDGNLKIVEEPEKQDYGKCDKCGSPMVMKKSFRGPFLACSAYPECKNTKSMKVYLKEQAGEIDSIKDDDAPVKVAKKKSDKKTSTKKTAAKDNKKSSAVKKETKTKEVKPKPAKTSKSSTEKTAKLSKSK